MRAKYQKSSLEPVTYGVRAYIEEMNSKIPSDEA